RREGAAPFPVDRDGLVDALTSGGGRRGDLATSPVQGRLGDTRLVSDENVQIIREGYEAFSRDGVEAILEFLDPEFEVTPFEEAPGGRSYRGHDGFRQYLSDTREIWGQFGWEATELIDLGASGVVRTRFRAE